ncbi:MAG: FkbM family methyltransferase [Phycisphaerae bacterium]
MSGLTQMVRGFLRVAVRPAPVRLPLLGITRLGLLPKKVWQRFPVQHAFALAVPGGGRIVYAATVNDHIGRFLYWRGLHAYEPETMGVWMHLARRARVVLDVGANTGVFSLLACAVNPAARVVAFEPVPQVRAKLLENIRRNGWEERCTVRSEAVSDFEGQTQFHIPFGDMPTSASMNTDGFRGWKGEVVQVAVTPLDTLFADAPVDLVKIDVEGFEDKVLLGMRGVLARCRPALIVECNPDGPIAAIESVLREFDYRFFQLRAGEPRRRDGIIADAGVHYRNYLCIGQDDWRAFTPRGD